MSVETIERCDCCGTEVPRLGSQGDDEGYYRAVFRHERWRFFPNRLSWAIAEKQKVTVCGRCWNAIGEAVSAREEAQ